MKLLKKISAFIISATMMLNVVAIPVQASAIIDRPVLDFDYDEYELAYLKSITTPEQFEELTEMMSYNNYSTMSIDDEYIEFDYTDALNYVKEFAISYANADISSLITVRLSDYEIPYQNYAEFMQQVNALQGESLELFHVYRFIGGGTYSSNPDILGYIYVIIDYYDYDYYYTLLRDEIDKIVSLTEQATTDFGKVAIIYDYLGKNYCYDYDYSIYNAPDFVEQKKGVCQAYAKFARLVLNEIGINNLTVSTTDVINHIWNMVECDGEWYHVDFTWGSGDSTFVDRIYRDVFMISTDRKVSQNRQDDDSGWYNSDSSSKELLPPLATNTKYENQFPYLTMTYSPFACIGEEVYYMHNYTGEIMHIDLDTFESTKLHDGVSSEQWLSWSTSAYKASGFSGQGDYLYYNERKNMMVYSISRDKSVILLDAEQLGVPDDNYIWDMQVYNDEIIYKIGPFEYPLSGDNMIQLTTTLPDVSSLFIDGIVLSQNTITVDRINNSTITAKSGNDNITWEITQMPDDATSDGVSIDNSGTITIDANATAGNYTISDGTDTATLTVYQDKLTITEIVTNSPSYTFLASENKTLQQLTTQLPTEVTVKCNNNTTTTMPITWTTASTFNQKGGTYTYKGTLNVPTDEFNNYTNTLDATITVTPVTMTGIKETLEIEALAKQTVLDAKTLVDLGVPDIVTLQFDKASSLEIDASWSHTLEEIQNLINDNQTIQLTLTTKNIPTWATKPDEMPTIEISIVD
ncbi:MAG: hypothetical protein ATN35_12365 [Epulopiscium sp. Nele67-Bin004]|nr:MAG: hypothetical protein ATN35_12365 [Epulopiscium sp. Nele67-Bin004]